ncbi:MAG: hypothetical protein ACLQK8_30220 [Streptosporangiaceae bacterium]
MAEVEAAPHSVRLDPSPLICVAASEPELRQQLAPGIGSGYGPRLSWASDQRR